MSSMIPPAGYSIPIPSGAPPPDYNALIQSDPFYKQQLEWMQGDAAIQQQRLQQDKLLAQQLNAINQQQARASVGGSTYSGDYGVAAAEAQAKLEREQAAHDNVNKAEYLREMLAGRGMVSSGQNAWEQQERTYQYDMFNKQIDADLAARRQSAADQAAQAAASRAQAQASMGLQLQEMQLRYQAGQTGYDQSLEDLQRGLARGQGEAAFDTYKRLLAEGKLAPGTTMAAWDATSGLYRDSTGQYYDAAGNRTSWSPPPPKTDYGLGGPTTGPYGDWSYADTQAPGVAYGPSGAAVGPGGGRTYAI